ncbi:hypothetical protein P153DRAFT_308727 [Dothidotthia symphoricarpi CBS 119687]|uniref:Uncharacterized protein n=1 Tax=Dothidotthia symphoricarpi CBS 119687 TaxID=1392245 RepID=A0A6A6APC0_9PLEO|nr:uncharacterized protein P153DRAFT_308727 [Dothidotthia symphoricarpi CBS 119687]KAF2133640.1 hypothetical protein P153DRAFT_308727 [Dothidotthia symphoricarpi CBS 119687]
MPEFHQDLATLCALCEQYTQLFVKNDFDTSKYLSNPSDRWIRDDEADHQFTGVAFQHHGNLQALRASGESCQLCRLILDDFADEELESCDGSLWLCPFSQPVRPSLIKLVSRGIDRRRITSLLFMLWLVCWAVSLLFSKTR